MTSVDTETPLCSGREGADIVEDPAAIARPFPLLMSRFSEMPGWVRSEFAAGQGKQYVLLRITPVEMTGRAYEEHAK